MKALKAPKTNLTFKLLRMDLRTHIQEFIPILSHYFSMMDSAIHPIRNLLSIFISYTPPRASDLFTCTGRSLSRFRARIRVVGLRKEKKNGAREAPINLTHSGNICPLGYSNNLPEGNSCRCCFPWMSAARPPVDVTKLHDIRDDKKITATIGGQRKERKRE